MQNPVFDSKKKGDAADRILNPLLINTK